MVFLFVFIIRIKICGTVWLTDASRAVNCFERDRFRWKKKGARKGAAVKSCPRTKRIATFGHRKSGCHRFKLRLSMLAITFLSLRDISPIRGITCLGRQKRTKRLLRSFFIHCESNGISTTRQCRVVYHQSVRTVYHHALACIKTFRNDDIQLLTKLMICNSLLN